MLNILLKQIKHGCFWSGVYEELHQQRRRYGKQDAVPAKCAALLLKYGFNIPRLISTLSTFQANEEQFSLDSGALAQ